MSGIDKNVIAMYVAEPAIFLIEVFVYGLTILINGDRFSAKGVCFLEVVFAGEAIGSAHGHLYFLIDEVDPAAYEANLFFGGKVVQSFHDEVFLVLEVECAIIEEPVEQMSYFRLVASDRQGLMLKFGLVAVLDGFLKQFE